MKNKITPILIIIGLVISLYLVYLHYRPEVLDSSFCNIDDYLSCSTVNKSPYAEFLGIPVSIIGVIGLLVIGLIRWLKPTYYEFYLFALSLGALSFMTYLTIAEIFWIKAICVLCLAISLIILTIFLDITIQYKKNIIKFIKEIRIE